ncbi:MAG: oligosaccharide flippase family protein [Flavobacteriales bacterium]|nr:oligosaccharide flippase family protein [Flavobacteriales bacterium]
MKNKFTLIRSSELVRNFLIYSFGALFVKGISFFLLPVFTRLLTPEEYGMVDLLSTFSNLIDVTLSLGLFQFIYMEYFHVDEESRKKLVRSMITIFLRVSAVLYLLTLVATIWISRWVSADIKSIWVLLVMVTNYLTFFQGLVILIMKVNKMALHVTIYQVAYGIISILLNVYSVYVLSQGVDGIIWSNLVSVGISFIYAVFYLYKHTGLVEHLKASDIKQVLRYSLPFVPNALAIWAMISLNRWILLHYCDLAEVGIFSVAVKFSALFDPLIIQPFLSAYAPKTLERFSKGDYRQHLLKYGIGSLVFFAIAGFVLRFIASWMIDDAYGDALDLIIPLSLAGSFILMTNMSNLILVYRKRVKWIMISVLLGTLMNVLFTYLLVVQYQSMGAALASVVGNVIWMLATLYFALREKKAIAI